MTDPTAPPDDPPCADCEGSGRDHDYGICRDCGGSGRLKPSPTLPPDAEDERAPTAEQLANLERAATDGYCTSLTPWITKWLIKQAREAERLRAELRAAYETYARGVYSEALLGRIQALESALRPLLGSREPTPENVAEVVARAVDDRDTLESIAEVAGDTGNCPCCEMELARNGEFIHDPDYGQDGDGPCPIAKVAAARSEPEGRE